MEPLRYRNKVEYSFGEDEDGGWCWASTGPGAGTWWTRWPRTSWPRSAWTRCARRREAWCREEGLSAYDRGDHDGLLRNLVVREGRRTGTVQARIVTSRGDFRTDEFAAALPADSVLWTQIEGVAETTFGGKTKKLKGAAAIEEQIEIAGTTLRFRISPDAFFQTNTEMAERLYTTAAEVAGPERHASGCTTSTAASARSRWRWRWSPAR